MPDACTIPAPAPSTGPPVAFHDDLRPDLHPLRDRLLQAGGDRLQLGEFVNGEVDEQYGKVLLDFAAFYPGRAVVRRGLDNRCHENAVAAAGGNPLARVMTGLALSSDGCWRVHSWVQTPSGIIETTIRRSLYFGCALPIEQAPA